MREQLYQLKYQFELLKDQITTAEYLSNISLQQTFGRIEMMFDEEAMDGFSPLPGMGSFAFEADYL